MVLAILLKTTTKEQESVAVYDKIEINPALPREHFTID